MTQIEALYCRPCRSSLCWKEVGRRILLGLEMIMQTTKTIEILRGTLRVVQSHLRAMLIKGETSRV